jgi:hypothetical protein
MKEEALFYIPSPDNEHDVDGPYDLAQMSRLLRDNIVSSKTLTCLDGEEVWKPFGEHPQFIVAREMPPEEVSTPSVAREVAKPWAKAPAPTSSTGTMVMNGVACVLLAVGGALAWLVSAADPGMGACVAVAGLILGLAGGGFTLAHVMKEAWGMRLKVLFVPFFDVFYFRSNLENCLPFICAKYIGTVLAVASLAGILSVGPFWNSILTTVGLR